MMGGGYGGYSPLVQAMMGPSMPVGAAAGSSGMGGMMNDNHQIEGM